jgi:hypothetical protein
MQLYVDCDALMQPPEHDIDRFLSTIHDLLQSWQPVNGHVCFVFSGPCLHAVWAEVRRQYHDRGTPCPGSPTASLYEQALARTYPAAVVLSSSVAGSVWEKICGHNIAKTLVVHTEDFLGATSFCLHNSAHESVEVVGRGSLSIPRSALDRPSASDAVFNMLLGGCSPGLPPLTTHEGLLRARACYNSDDGAFDKSAFLAWLNSVTSHFVCAEERNALVFDGDPYLARRCAVAYLRTLLGLLQYHVNCFQRHADSCPPFAFDCAPNPADLKLALMDTYSFAVPQYPVPWTAEAHALAVCTPQELGARFPALREAIRNDPAFPLELPLHPHHGYPIVPCRMAAVARYCHLLCKENLS